MVPGDMQRIYSIHQAKALIKHGPRYSAKECAQLPCIRLQRTAARPDRYQVAWHLNTNDSDS